MNLIRLSPSASCESGVSSTQLQRGLGHIEHRRSQLASRPAVYVIEDDSSINAGFDQTQGEEEEAGIECSTINNDMICTGAGGMSRSYEIRVDGFS